MKRNRRSYENRTSIEDGGDPSVAVGGAAPVAPVAPAAGSEGGAAPGAVAGEAAPVSLGEKAAGGAPAAAAPAAPVVPAHWAPEKLQVKAADGTIDEAATAAKVAESYRALETRMGTGDVRPATAAEYAPTLPEGAGVTLEELAADPMYNEFLDKAHAKGFTNDQVSMALEEYLQRATGLAGQVQELNAAEAHAELGKLWGDEPTVLAKLQTGYKALRAFATPVGEGQVAKDLPGSQERIQAKYANDPDFWAVMANMGKELGEDRAPGAVGAASDVDVNALMQSKAYWNENDPEHAATKAKVNAHFATKFPGARK